MLNSLSKIEIDELRPLLAKFKPKPVPIEVKPGHNPKYPNLRLGFPKDGPAPPKWRKRAGNHKSKDNLQNLTEAERAIYTLGYNRGYQAGIKKKNNP